MPKKAKELGALEVGRLAAPGLHMVGGVAGLGLQVSSTGARSWILRTVIGGKRRDVGLGGFPDVTLAGAREAARAAKAKIAEGIDPIEDARAKRSALAASIASAITFSEAAAAFIVKEEREWRNPKHAQQWRNTIADYAEPIIGRILVRDINQSHVLSVLEPIWLTKTETAKRLRGRIEAVLDWARVRGYRPGENPARWRGHLDKLLQSPGKVRKRKHHPALPFAQIGAFVAELREQEGIAARAVEFAILTAARSGEVRGATWDEIDLSTATWTIPADRMKAGVEHREVLSDAALAILRRTPEADRHGLIFPSPRKGDELSDMTLTAVLRRMNRRRDANGLPRWIDPKTGRDAVVHGFRSAFRDWAAECTNYPRDVAEMALAHTIEDKVEAAYRRGDLIEKRRRMMRDWAKFIAKTESTAMAIPINRMVAA